MPNLAAATELLHLFGDATRVRLLALLARQELTVAELVNATQLPQSRVSTHLGKLREADVLRDRKVGTSTWYGLNDAGMPEEARKVWTLLTAEIDDAVLETDRRRCDRLLEARNGSGKWPELVAGEMERHYSPGRTWEAMARGFAGLVRLGDVLDVGSGDGTIAELLAPRAKSWVCVDVSEKVVSAAKKRLAELKNVSVEVGDAHELPYPKARFDQVLLFHVLASAQSPAKLVAEAARVLRSGGALAVITLDAHDHADVTATYHHVHPGFAPRALRKMLERAGLDVQTCEITSRERRAPHFAVVTAFASKP